MPLPGLLSLFNVWALTIAGGAQTLAKLIFVGIITAFATVVTLIVSFRSLFFFVFTITVIGLLGMLLVENQDTVLEVGTEKLNDMKIFINEEVIREYINPLLECLEVLVNLVNIVVEVIESIVWRVSVEFGDPIFPHAAYDPADISIDLDDIFSKSTINTNQTTKTTIFGTADMMLLDEWVQAARIVDVSRLNGEENIDMELRAKAISHKIYKMLMLSDPQERVDIIGYFETACGFIRAAFSFLIDLIDTVIEIVFIVIEEVLDMIDGDFNVVNTLKFIEVIVRILIDIILEFLDPKGCFRKFPKNFPNTLGPCMCPTVFPTQDDVPEDALNMLLGCLCTTSEVDINGNWFEDILQPCMNMPWFENFLGLIQFFIDIYNDIRKDIERIRDIIWGIIARIQDRINSIKNLFKRDFTFMGKDGHQYTTTIEEHGDVATLRIFQNHTVHGMREWKTHTFPSQQWFDTQAAEFERLREFIIETDKPMDDVISQLAEYRSLKAQVARTIKAVPTAEEKVSNKIRDHEDAPDTSMLRSFLMHRAKKYLSSRIENVQERTDWENVAFRSTSVCGEGCGDDIGHLVRFVRDMLVVTQTALKEPTGSKRHREHLGRMDFGTTRQALGRVANHVRSRRAPNSEAYLDPIRETIVSMERKSKAFTDPVGFPDYIKSLDPKSAEETLSWLESRAHLVDRIQNAQSVSSARYIIAEEIRTFHQGVAQQITRKTLEGRVVPVIGISIILIGGIASTALVALAGALVASLIPLCSLIAVLFAIFFFTLFGVLASIGASTATIVLTGEVAAADPINPFVYLFDETVGAIFLGGLDAISSDGLKDTLIDVTEAGGWYLVIEFVRNFIPTIPFYASPPPIIYDPESGLTLDTLRIYMGNILSCRPDEVCTTGGAYGGAPCRCRVYPGSFAQRDATPENPCVNGRYYCIPFFREGVQLEEFELSNPPPSCYDLFDYPQNGYMIGSTDFWSVVKNWFYAGDKAFQVLARGLLRGWKIYPIGIIAPIIFFPFCCIKPLGSYVQKITIALLFLSPVFLYWVAPYMEEVSEMYEGRWYGDIFHRYSDPTPFQPNEVWCAGLHIFSLFVSIGLSLLVLVPIVTWLFLGGFFWIMDLIFFLTIPVQLVFLFIWYFVVMMGPNTPDIGIILYHSASNMAQIIEERNNKNKK